MGLAAGILLISNINPFYYIVVTSSFHTESYTTVNYPTIKHPYTSEKAVACHMDYSS